jgi:hypothetical protein
MLPPRVELIQGVQLAIRVGVAAALSLAVAYLLKVQFPIYAMIAPAAPVRGVRRYGLYRAPTR